MSLEIDTDTVVGIYALGQWFKVTKGTLFFDAYEVVQKFSENYVRCYSLGAVYPQIDSGFIVPDLDHPKVTCRNATPRTGCQFRDLDTGEFVALSLVEIKAWRYIR